MDDSVYLTVQELDESVPRMLAGCILANKLELAGTAGRAIRVITGRVQILSVSVRIRD